MRRFRIFVTVVLAATCLALANCSLGLDASLIDRAALQGDASNTDPQDGQATDGHAEPDAGSVAEACDKDTDCVAPHACLTARCDLQRKVCVYDACKQAEACTSAVCDMDAGACQPAKPYTFRAAQFRVGTGTACSSSNTAKCFAAVHPFVFVATNLGPVAFVVLDPASTTPRSLPVTGVGFVPTAVVASGNRVFFLGASSSGSGATRLPLAWLDVPSNPFVDELLAHTVLATVDLQIYQPRIQPRTGETALFFDSYSYYQYPSTVLAPPFVEPLDLVATPLTAANKMVPEVTSGERLLLSQADEDAGTSRVAFVTAAGSTSPQVSAEVTLSPSAPVAAQTFSTGPTGGIFWTYVARTGKGGGVARGSFLVADETAAIEAGPPVDIESFEAVTSTIANPVGPAVLVDHDTALVTAANPATPTQAAVQFVEREGGLVKNADGSPRRYTVSAGAHQVGVAASNGIGYVLVYESSSSATIHVFDARCAL